MTISTFFRSLGAPLKNDRWSWGAETSTGDIYLRVWTDEIETINGVMCARLTHHAAFRVKPTNGYRERRAHVEKVKQGAKAHVVLCHDPKHRKMGKPRRIRSYCRTVIPGRRLHSAEGDDWLEI